MEYLTLEQLDKLSDDCRAERSNYTEPCAAWKFCNETIIAVATEKVLRRVRLSK